MYSSENAGLVKFDLLGLKTLTVIDKTIKRLKLKNINLDISTIDQQDKNVFSLLSTGDYWLVPIRKYRNARCD